MVEVFVKSTFAEGARISYPEWTLSVLSRKLEHITGIPPESQRLQSTTPSGEVLFTKSDVEDSLTTMESSMIPEQSTLLVEDTRSPENQLHFNEEDINDLPVLTAEEYSKKSGTVLDFKRQNKLGRFADEHQKKSSAQHQESGKEHTLDDVKVSLNDECFVRLSSGQTVRGVVAFIGDVPHIEPGIWVGIRLFTPDGRNNGIIKGVKSFDVEEKHGVLARPMSVRPSMDDEEES